MAAAARNLATHKVGAIPVVFSEVPRAQRDVIQPFSLFVTRRQVLDLLRNHVDEDEVDDHSATVLYYRIRADLESSLESIVDEEPYYRARESYRTTLQRIFHKEHPGKFVFLELRDQNIVQKNIEIHAPENRTSLTSAQKIQNIVSQWESVSSMDESEKMSLREKAGYLVLALETEVMETAILEQGKQAILSMITELSEGSDFSLHGNFEQALDHLLKDVRVIQDDQPRASLFRIPRPRSGNVESFRSIDDLIQFFKLWKSTVNSDQVERYLDLVQDFISLTDAGDDLAQKGDLVSDLKGAVETMSNELMDQGVITPDSLVNSIDDLTLINTPKTQVHISPPESWEDTCSLLGVLGMNTEGNAKFGEYKEQVLRIQKVVESGIQPTNHQIDIALLGFVRIINMFKNDDEILMQDRKAIVDGFKTSMNTFIENSRFCLAQNAREGSTSITPIPAPKSIHSSSNSTSSLTQKIGQSLRNGARKFKFW